MDQSGDRRTNASLQACNWARVAGSPEHAWAEWEAAKSLSNSAPGELCEWQRWLLDHLKNQRLDAEQAIARAEMWVKVAAVQPGAMS
ncbi:hypothetical protein ABZX95_20720 [Streptomyces sp. NPDC004232]|uniref:hypothetical protein n=1 Tax=Streptomyces sp. NPDC004232 TaxID=3154454 RepID=UPI001D257AC2|nr:hypothetical protein [Streptomyces sp. tea 10]